LSTPPRQVSPWQIAATLGIVAIAVGVLAFYVGRTVGNPSEAAASPSARTSASVSPSASALTPPCGSLKFGPNLAALPGDAGKRTYGAAPATTINTAHHYLVTLQTTKGVITLCLDPALAPLTVNNFVFLTRNGFYNGLKFHRVVAGFVIQGGDPKGDGTGGPGYKFNDEPVKGDYLPGAVAMANSGANTNGSQFFICTADDRSLPKSYNLFGTVQTGLDVVLKIVQGDVMTTVTVQEEQP
jgi:peptidyl-prolyl cis-trans isomerase B (cyclophilin B)